MKKVFYLSTCDTCKRIMSDLDLPEDMLIQDLKKEPISIDDLSHLRNFTASYEDLLNKRARIYKELDLKNKSLSEEELKKMIAEHYTLLKRPVFIDGDNIFIGNAKKTKDELKKYFNSSDS